MRDDRRQSQRDAMLASLLNEMGRHHRRRKFRRVGAAVCAVLVMVGMSGLAAVSFFDDPAGGTEFIARSNEPAAENSRQLRARIEMIHTDSSIQARYTTASKGVMAVFDRIDDATLLSELAEIARPAGIIRSERGTRMSQAVADNRRRHTFR